MGILTLFPISRTNITEKRSMKTTLDIQDPLFREAKIVSAGKPGDR